jgi:4-aminobutyrate aminotransferase-like enzyme
MVATVFADPARVGAVMQHCLNEGRLILMSAGTDGTVLRWMPPLVVTAAEIDEAVQSFGAALKATA